MKPQFDQSQHRLRRIALEVWEGFVYASLAADAPVPLATRAQKLRDDVVGRFDMACYRTVMRETMTWRANWKNLIENFTESYHVPIAHGKTFAQHNKPLEDYMCGEDNPYSGYRYPAEIISHDENEIRSGGCIGRFGIGRTADQHKKADEESNMRWKK